MYTAYRRTRCLAEVLIFTVLYYAPCIFVASVIEYSMYTLPLSQSCVPSSSSCGSPPLGSTLGPNRRPTKQSQSCSPKLSTISAVRSLLKIVPSKSCTAPLPVYGQLSRLITRSSKTSSGQRFRSNRRSMKLLGGRSYSLFGARFRG